MARTAATTAFPFAPPTDGRSLLDGEPRTMVFSEHSHRTGAMVRDADFLYSWAKGIHRR